MKIKRPEQVEGTAVSGCEGVVKRVVLGPADGSCEIVLRLFSLDPGSSTPRHQHDFPHLVKIERGCGVAVDMDGAEHPLGPGDYVYVAPLEVHNFVNTGDQMLEFICIVPARGEPPVI